MPTPRNALSFDAARRLCRAQGFTLTRRPDREYRLNLPGGSEETASYTNCLIDAVGTAQAWRASLNRQ